MAVYPPGEEAVTLKEQAAADRLWARVDKSAGPDGCWVWLGSANNSGYGAIRIEPKPAGPALVHRFAYELMVGPIPEGFEIDHRCNNRRCVNPAHLQLVTHPENCQRGDLGQVWAGHQKSKTHCPQGHPYDLLNTYFDKNGGRQCRTCKREHMRSYRQGRR